MPLHHFGDQLSVGGQAVAVEGKSGFDFLPRVAADDIGLRLVLRQRGHIELHPANPDFQPIVVGPGDAFALEGIAVGLIRNHMMM